MRFFLRKLCKLCGKDELSADKMCRNKVRHWFFLERSWQKSAIITEFGREGEEGVGGVKNCFKWNMAVAVRYTHSWMIETIRCIVLLHLLITVAVIQRHS